jgi:hypothetical protein
MPPFHVWLTPFGLFLIRVAKMNQKNLKKLQPSKIGAAIMIQAKEGKNGQGIKNCCRMQQQATSRAAISPGKPKGLQQQISQSFRLTKRHSKGDKAK